MSFKPLLNSLLEDVPGALGAVILDWEGEAVDQAAKINEFDLKLIGAHSGIILNHLNEVLDDTDGGALDEIVIRTGKNKTLISPLAEDYLLVLQLGPEAIVARASSKMRGCVRELRDDFYFD